MTGLIDRRQPRVAQGPSTGSRRPIARANRPSIPRWLIVLAMLLPVSTGREEDEDESQSDLLLEQMRSLAAATTVSFVEQNDPVEFAGTPVFRYADQPRNFIDATLWVWMNAGRPVAFQKIEALDFGEARPPKWQFCFASVSEDLVAAEWPNGRPFQSTAPGVSFEAIQDAPVVAASKVQRRLQARQLARNFSARIVTDPANNTTQEMRLLSTPLLDYNDPQSKEYLGAVYGLSTNGTNPDVLILLQIREVEEQLRWHFAPARMTSGAVTLDYEEMTVWETEWLNAGDGPFPTWTYFVSPRTPPEDAATDL